MTKLEHHRMSHAFESASLRSGSLPMGHFIGFDHFHMSQPTFPPHPHAGFSAITWMLPWSPGAFVNRDSFGDRSIIAPGTLHWTMAGSGMLHEEIPERPGTDCEGLQIFVKLPEPLELMDGQAFHRSPSEIPTVDLGGGTARVLVGELGGVASSIPSHARTTMLHVDLDGDVELHVPQGAEAFGVVLRGAAGVGGARLGVDEAASLVSGATTRMTGKEATVLVAWSDPMTSSPRFSGPFSMFSPDRLIDAQRRYAQGQMGSLTRSDVAWGRS